MRTSTRLLACVAALAAGPIASAQTPLALNEIYEDQARAAPGFNGLSSARGARLFKSTHGNDWSCATCHADPLAVGKHAKTGKEIAPLAPAANPARFTTFDKTEKWFRRNCNDVLGRECTSLEKGDVMAYLLSLGR